MNLEKFEVDEKVFDDYVILYTKGYINNLGGNEIAKRCYRQMDNGSRNFVLNLEKTKIINSIGISILIEIIEKVLELNGKLCFCGLTNSIAKTFRIMGLAQYAIIAANEDEAIAQIFADQS